jgi:hypothetical protein
MISSHRQLEFKTLKEDVDTFNRQVSMDSKEYEKLTEKNGKSLALIPFLYNTLAV